MTGDWWRSALFPLVVIAALVWLGAQTLRDDGVESRKIPYSEALELVNRDDVGITLATFDPNTHEVDLKLTSGREHTTVYPVEQSAFQLQQLLQRQDIPFVAKRLGATAFWSLLTGLLPFVLLLVLWLGLMRSFRRRPATESASQERSPFQ